MNREQKRKAERKAKKVNPSTEATKAAQTILDSSAIIVKSIKGGQNPSHLEVYGMAGIILKDVYEELLKEQRAKDEPVVQEASDK